ncbi:hypothetical protein [Vogesella sp. LIG4]|uniref:hypothetical protein n=1 Tax=Vogesella sp. LIG4 TaxID=1192162 RepID=UPI00081FC3D1|nr:hypothetical protein [Vogesella sp. LIG4]SCK12394.1 hypothetical protein PSELUDRAFT_1110 [Vogesella sp. LIG4]
MLARFAKPSAAATSEAVIFNYQRPTRARLVAQDCRGGLWLVEVFDSLHKVWVWQDESHDMEKAVDDARRLSLFPG